MQKASMTLTNVSRCPQCNIADPNLLYQTHFCYPDKGDNNVWAWLIYKCNSCHDMVGAKCMVNYHSIQQQTLAYLSAQPRAVSLMIPPTREVNSDLPMQAHRYLSQAFASLHAPDGAIMLAGSAIDAMLKVKGYVDGSLYARIKLAVDDKILTPSVSEWAHAVRLESNKPRHADLDEPHATRDLAEQTIRFTEALGEFLFALPAKIERGKVASKQAADSALEGPDDDTSQN